jgi:hypothetical protein
MCREKALIMCLFDAVANAANMRSGHTEAFLHNHSRPWTSAPCLTLTGTSDAEICSGRGLHASTFLSPFPRCGFAFRTSRDFRRLGTMETLTPAQLTDHAGLPAYCTTPLLSFRLQPRGLPDHRLPPRQRDQRVSDFAMNEQARRSSPPNRVRYPTDQQFASGCSPPRLTATQLPSATELWLPPARTFTVLIWRPHGRTRSRESGNPGYMHQPLHHPTGCPRSRA